MNSYKDFKQSLNEASSIPMSELGAVERKSFEKFMSTNNVDFLELFDGVHGKILMVTVKMSGHLNKKDSVDLGKILSNATKLKTFRWISITSEANGIQPMRLSIGL